MTNFRPTRALINLTALANNLKQIRNRLPAAVKVLAVVKANGYGHGAVGCAERLEKEKVDWFGVATVEEGIELRDAGIKTPILVFGGTPHGIPNGAEEAVIRHQLTPTVFDLTQAKALSRAATKLKKRVSLHIKVDTGMTRLGIYPQEVGNFVRQLSELPGIKTEGIFSHFAQADLADPKVTDGQAKRFREVAAQFPLLLAHIANSAATVSLGAMDCGMVRPGLMLYGAYPAPRFSEQITLQPVMTLQTEIMALKDVPRGQGISYGWTSVTKRPSRIATLPLGYADGYPRSLSNRASVLIHGKRAPVVGAVCMDLMMIDVTDIPAAKVGDQVTLLGCDMKEHIRADELGGLAGLMTYELFCGIGARVPRIFREDS